MNESKTTVDVNTIKKQAIQVITNPVAFYKSMAKSGGFVEPMIFIAVVGLVVGAIRAVLLLGTSFGTALGALILMPIIAPLAAFIGTVIVFLIWKIMGSQESYETAYRCVAYTFAIVPITTLLTLIPYVGSIAATAWGCYLCYIASVEVHAIAQKKAKMTWGIIAAVFIIAGFTGERQAREFEERWGDEEAAAEEMGKAFGNFFKGLEKAASEEAE